MKCENCGFENNGKAKPYQVKQIREILISNKFDIIKDDEI